MKSIFYMLCAVANDQCMSNASIAVPYGHAPLTIAFQKGKFAASRRYSPIPQITSDNQVSPTRVLCTRSDQTLSSNTKWKCSGNTPIDRVTVQWEGYESKQDTTHFLKDSFSVKIHRSPLAASKMGSIFSIAFLLGIAACIVNLCDSTDLSFVLGAGFLAALCCGSSDDNGWFDGDGDSSIR
jgi:hypothetical protein